MTLYVFDTDSFSLYQNSHPRVVANIVRHRSDRLVLTVVTVDEQVSSWLHAVRNATTALREQNASRRLAETVESYSDWPILPEAGGIVVTRNLRDFRRVPNLVCEDWSV